MNAKLIKCIMLFVLSTMLISLSACSSNTSSDTSMVFSFSTSTPATSNDEKIIYINNDIEKLILDCKLKVDSGDVIVQIVNATNEEVVWEDSYSKDADFKIEMSDLKEKSEFLLKIHANQSKEVTLTITSDTKLVEDKVKPERYNIE